MTAHYSQRIGECRLFLHIPDRSTHRERLVLGKLVGYESNQRKQAQESGCGASNSQVRPLALRFQSQVGTGFLESDFDIPAQDEPMEDLEWFRSQVGAFGSTTVNRG